MKTPQTKENIQHFLDELQRPVKILTEWELDFLSSITTQFERTGSLSEKQFVVLERIYADKTA